MNSINYVSLATTVVTYLCVLIFALLCYLSYRALWDLVAKWFGSLSS